MLMALVLAVSPWGQAVASATQTDATSVVKPAVPPELAEASDAFARGVQAFKEGRYEAAHEEFSRAQELEPHPDTLFNLGLAQQRVDRHVEAWQSFETLLLQARDEQEREDILEAQAASRPYVAWLRVVADPASTVVCLDGAPMPVDDEGRHAVLTTSGPHRVEVHGQRRTLELEGGESRTFELSAGRSAGRAPSRKKLRALAGLTIGGAGAAAGLGLGAAFASDPPVRAGLGAGAALAGTLAISTTVAALVVHRRARRWKPAASKPGCSRE